MYTRLFNDRIYYDNLTECMVRKDMISLMCDGYCIANIISGLKEGFNFKTVMLNLRRGILLPVKVVV